eukprot:TRINITY_DN11895_c0_g1_i1.p1 TRINITY_DN11895_c0_g1~~TRINITY_DN11895_c0_g1_i1.p1  ORF type:complete len:206 (-),score=68.58 TRINITY_DN11895_c0_g1_i1:50-667(-)
MSTRPGNHVKKKPGQKHQNSHAFKFDKYRTDPKAVMLKNMQVNNCCLKCTDVLEWKIKYGKYKPLTAPGKCVECLQKTVKHNYHIRCGPCVGKVGKCAKCGEKTSDLVNTQAPGQTEVARQEADFQRDLKSLPERQRRTFLRYLNTLQTKSEGGVEKDAHAAKDQLSKLIDKYGKDGGGFDLDDLDEDFDDLGIDDDLSCSENDD